MGGRGSGGGPGPGSGKSGKASAAKKPGAGGGSAGGGSGGSAGSSKGAGKGNAGAGTGGVDGGKGSSGGQAGGGGEISGPKQYAPMVIHYGDGLTDAEKAEQQHMLDQLPANVLKRLRDRGTKIWVGRRADETPGWGPLAKDTGWTSDEKIADGREIGSLSFYVGHRNELFISVHHKGGSVNVYVHELGHAADYQWTGDGKLISNDPDWIAMHNKWVKDNPLIRAYFRGGPSGSNAASGRKETFAEGFAVYNKGGRPSLIAWIKSEEAADEMIRIWKKYGVI
ncbi:metalloprotease [Mycobacterium phage Yecey3]|uniref:Metalloprotease n=1 Tax=Mycobacterium phage Yecey3 TaxID=2656617 RepID=A0A649V8U5_9CAUD|nr:peptidase [Mycobacterium phage Yecey3]QGJ88757.1 metalloprotease [Mycobacterium phage Yecey3]